MTLVSVIVPCFNCEELVETAVKSVLSQSYQNFEMLLIDNNSTDATLAKLRQFEAEHPGKIKVFSEKKKGACAARNLGLWNAKGDWIQFLDADDELLPTKLEKQLELATMHHNPGVVAGGYRKIRKYNASDASLKSIVEDIAADKDTWMGLINSRLGNTSANLWSKGALLKVDGWNDALSSSQEYDLLFRLLKNHVNIVVCQHVHTIVYAQAESISRTNDQRRLYRLYLNRYNLRCDIYSYLLGQGLLNDKYKSSLYQYLYFHLLLIGELDMSHFKEQVRLYDFKRISIPDKLKLLKRFLRNSTKRKYAHSNIILKSLEWQYHFIKNMKLVLYEAGYRHFNKYVKLI